jgi:hypothetical protein
MDHAEPTSVAGSTHPHFQAFQLLQTPGHFSGEKAVNLEIAATITAVAYRKKLIRPFNPQPDRIPAEPPDHGNQAQSHSLPVMGQGFLHGRYPPEGRNDLLRAFPQEKASNLPGIGLATLQGTAQASMEDEAERRLLDEFFYNPPR